MPQIPLIALELFLGFGVPLAWGVWQLVSLRRERLRDQALDAERQARAAELNPKPGPGDSA